MHELTPDDATVVSEPDEVIDPDEDQIGISIAIDRPALPPDMERVLYGVSSWPSVLRTGIADSLLVAGIAFEWDEHGDLVVAADAEARVDEIFEAMPDPDDPDMIEADGLDVQEVLSSMWQATGTLAKHPEHSDAVLSCVEAADALSRMALPFGFEASVWREIVGHSVVLRDAFESDEDEDQLSDDQIQEGCRTFHDLLRHYI